MSDSDSSIVHIDNSYQPVFDALSRISDIVSATRDLDLPRICVIGDQSSGKSSLLCTLAEGVEFPTAHALCTKAPIVVHSRRGAEEKIEVRASTNGEFKRVQSDDVADAIREAQDALMEGTGGAKVTMQEVTVRVTGPDRSDFGIIDLPGIIHNGEGTVETQALIEKYIAPPQTLVLLLTMADQDEELAKCLELAKKHDPDNTRTLRVLSKFDNFTSDESRKRAVQLVCDGAEQVLGGHAVVCRHGGGNKYNSARETMMLKEAARKAGMEIPATRAGALALKERLPSLFAKLIQTNVPALKTAAEAHIDDAIALRGRLGHAPLNSLQMIAEVQRVLQSPAHYLGEALTPAMEAFRESVHATKDRVTLEWVGSKYKHDAYKPPFFQSQPTFDRCMAEIVEWWKEPAMQLALSVGMTLADVLDPLACEAVGVSSCLADALKTAWKDASSAIMEALNVAVATELKREVAFGTINHYLSDKYAEEQILPNSVIEKLVGSIFSDNPFNDISLSQQDLKDRLQDARDAIIGEDKRASVREHAIKHVYRAVHATWSVEKKTVTDNVLKVVRDTVIDAHKQWVTCTLLTDAAITAAAVEDKDVAERRRECGARIDRMQEVLKEIAVIEQAG